MREEYIVLSIVYINFIYPITFSFLHNNLQNLKKIINARVVWKVIWFDIELLEITVLIS